LAELYEITQDCIATHTVKGSKFIAFAFPVRSEEDIQAKITVIKTQHPKARHWCYAWKLGLRTIHHRIHDDGEPSGTAGKPIYQQIESKQLSNVLVIVVRYFGGILLGTGGLVKAYKEATKLCLTDCPLTPLVNTLVVSVQSSLSRMQQVLSALKELDISIFHQSFTDPANLQFEIPEKELTGIMKRIKAKIDKIPIQHIVDPLQWTDCQIKINHHIT